MTIRVLLVDDQALLRKGFHMILDEEPDITVVGEAGDGAMAVDLAQRGQPDVVLMDVRMPGMDGIEATRRIVERTPDVRILILTTFDLDEYAFAGLKAGASGFLLKDVPPQDLVAAIRAVSSGDAVVAPRVTRRLLDLFATRLPAGDQEAGASVDPLRDLTARERDVLLVLAQGFSNAEIAEELYVSEATVKSHVARILAKLDLRDRVQAVVFAYQNGLVGRS